MVFQRSIHMTQTKQEILLESGTNELEVIMFKVGSGVFGINVLKVREIIHAQKATPIPQSHPNVEGVIRLREEVLPVIHLSKVLGLPDSPHPESDRFIVTELNKQRIAFRVHEVERIHRISWEQIERPDDLTANEKSYAIGIISTGNVLSILLDFEKVLVEINPTAGVHVEDIKKLGIRERSEKQLIIAEDSPILRQLLIDTLHEAGYERVIVFENGKEAWDYLAKVAADTSSKPSEQVQLIVTDIEMPQMDGHHLIRRIKENSRLKIIPVIIFSSLITEDLQTRGEKVGATAQITKPEIVELVETIDTYIL